jgi:hypothetical protein
MSTPAASFQDFFTFFTASAQFQALLLRHVEMQRHQGNHVPTPGWHSGAAGPPGSRNPIGAESYRVGCEQILKSCSEHWHIPVFQSLDSRSKVLPIRLRK